MIDQSDRIQLPITQRLASLARPGTTLTSMERIPTCPQLMHLWLALQTAGFSIDTGSCASAQIREEKFPNFAATYGNPPADPEDLVNLAQELWGLEMDNAEPWL